MTNRYQQNLNSVKVCKQDLCVEAKGKNAEAIVTAVAFAAVLVGLGAFLRALK